MGSEREPGAREREDECERESTATSGLTQKAAEGGSGGVQGPRESETQGVVTDGSILGENALGEKEKKRRGRPCKKVAQEGAMLSFLVNSKDEAAFAASKKISRTPTKELRSRSVPVGKGRSRVVPEENGEEDDPDPADDTGNTEEDTPSRSVSDGDIREAGITDTKGATGELKGDANNNTAGDAGAQTPAAVNGGGAPAGQEELRARKVDVGVSTDTRVDSQCQQCGGRYIPHQENPQQLNERLDRIELMLETLIRRNQEEGCKDKHHALWRGALDALLTEVGEVKDDAETLKRWLGGLVEDVEGLKLTMERQGRLEQERVRSQRKQPAEVTQEAEKGDRRGNNNNNNNINNCSFNLAYEESPTYPVTSGGLAGTQESLFVEGGLSQNLREETQSQKPREEAQSQNPMEGLSWRQGAPGLMTKGEWPYEKKERIKRLNNVVARGLTTVRGTEAVDFVTMVKVTTRLSIRVLEVRPLPTGDLLFKLATHQQKKMLMSQERLKALREKGLAVRDDLTPRQEEVAGKWEEGPRSTASSRVCGLKTADTTGTRTRRN